MVGTVQKSKNQFTQTGYYISLFGAALILLWIGIFKFTPTEAAAIKPLVENHFLTDFFIVKDLMLLGFGLMLVQNNK
jgi:uncharacterized membrane protein YkgB